MNIYLNISDLAYMSTVSESQAENYIKKVIKDLTWEKGSIVNVLKISERHHSVQDESIFPQNCKKIGEARRFFIKTNFRSNRGAIILARIERINLKNSFFYIAVSWSEIKAVEPELMIH